MTARVVLIVFVLLLAGCTAGSESDPAAEDTAASRSIPTSTPAALSEGTKPPVTHPRGVILDCSRRSEASFPGAFADSRNLVVGPLVLVGAAYTPPSVVREFDGNKFPLLVKAGHTVTVRLSREVQRFAGLAYGGLGKRPLPQGEVRLRDTAHTMTFVACQPGRPSRSYRPEGPSGSYADGQQVTFWSGFVLTRAPSCLPLEVFVDGDASPRRVGLALGGRCRQA